MIPIYLSYFAGGSVADNKTKTIKNAFGFVIGFTIVFILLGAFASSIGIFLKQYSRILEIVFGIVIIVFGINFTGLINIKFLNRANSMKVEARDLNFIKSVLFGIIFSVTWTPCVGTFLGSALMLAATSEHVIEGIFMLLCYSIGLAIPFLVAAVLINRLKTTFDFIKKHYKVINIICGIFLIGIGILMLTGYLRQFLFMLSV